MRPSLAQKSLLRLLPSIWCGAVDAPQRKGSGKTVIEVSAFCSGDAVVRVSAGDGGAERPHEVVVRREFGGDPFQDGHGVLARRLGRDPRRERRGASLGRPSGGTFGEGD